MFLTIQSLFEMLKESFKSFGTCKERQSETQLLKSLKRKNIAIDYAEKLIFIADEAYIIDEDGNEVKLSEIKKYARYRKGFFLNNSK